MNFTPVIIIGAGRSGTNMLRDIITDIPSLETWDCDEINPIWRYGHRSFPTDELSEEQATPRIKNFIREQFQKIHRATGASNVVEKTCANSLRIPYVFSIFPDAKYIFIYRDGRDVVPSAMKRWTSKLDFRYTLKKLRYVPFIDLPFYVAKFGSNRIKRIMTRKDVLSFWGPIYKGLKSDVQQKELLEVCAEQWKHCTTHMLQHRALIPSSQLFEIQYEEFVNAPVAQMSALCSYLGVELSTKDLEARTAKVSTKSVGSYKRKLTSKEQETLHSIVSETLAKANY